MKLSKYTLLYILLVGIVILTGCSDHLFDDEKQANSNRILLSGDIEQLAVTRVNDNGFCDGDKMGVYIVDYEGDYPGTLKVSGNRADNVQHTFDASQNKWNSAYDIYWKDKHTHVDIYGYYPIANPESIEDCSFEVQKDQSKESKDGEMGGYESSDFLWGKVADVTPTANTIRLPLTHRMSNAKVTLVKGSGFTDEEWANTEKTVLTANVARKASINLSTGEVKVAGSVENTATIPSRHNNEWRTIVIPQTIPAGTTLFSITIGGEPYKFSKSGDFTYQAGKMMNFGIKVDKLSTSGDYKLTLISESITPWESDLVSHNATAKEYIIINSTPGGLKDAIVAAHKDYTQVRNLKITGEINSKDFYFMRDSMPRLSALNLKEVRIKAYGRNEEYEENQDDQIPNSAFYFIQTTGGSNSLNRLILPDHLKSIGSNAFYGCKYLTGSLVIPEGVTEIRRGAFSGCYGINSIICRGDMPAYIEENAFEGIAKDNFTVEVPESAIAQYQTANGWRDFKRIAAHHELVCRPSVACALSTEHKQTLTINAEGEWEVASKPDWCEVSPSNGNKKTEVTLTIKSMAKGAGNRNGKVVFQLKDKEYTHECNVSQYGYEYGEDEWVTLQKATKGRNGGINIVLIGDGYNAKDIANGDYLKNIQQEVEYFFGIEPYKTYREYFNIYTAMPLSTESGIGTVNTIRYNRFNTTFTAGVGLKADYDEIFSYVLGAPTVNKDNLNQTLIIIIPNSTDYGGITQMWADGSAIAFCPLSTYDYPLDTRGVIQHEAGGHGFGKLGDEYIYHNAFIDACGCSCCGHVDEFNWAKSLGWYDNLSLTGKMHEVDWSHLIYDDRYSDIVDIYEGGFMHTRGVFRSEPNSCMNNDIPYYSTISRESIVKRIKLYAGETFTFEDFVKNDKRDAGVVESRAFGMNGDERIAGTYQHTPVFHKGSPLKMQKVRRRK